jgi:hypothetical protein
MGHFYKMKTAVKRKNQPPLIKGPPVFDFGGNRTEDREYGLT